MVKNIGTASLVERYGGRVDSPTMSHDVSVFSLGDYHGSKTKLSFGRRTQVRLATHEIISPFIPRANERDINDT